MGDEDDLRVEDLYEYYEQQRAGLAELQERMNAITITAHSPRREVEVTVGFNGIVSDIVFPGSAYRRLTPQELSSMIMRTIGDARERAADQAADLLRPLMPAGLDARDLVRGKMPVNDLVPATPRLPGAVVDQLNRSAS